MKTDLRQEVKNRVAPEKFVTARSAAPKAGGAPRPVRELKRDQALSAAQIDHVGGREQHGFDESEHRVVHAQGGRDLSRIPTHGTCQIAVSRQLDEQGARLGSQDGLARLVLPPEQAGGSRPSPVCFVIPRAPPLRVSSGSCWRPSIPDPRLHSIRKATTGSTRAARLAGTKLATKAIKSSSPADSRKDAESVTVTR